MQQAMAPCIRTLYAKAPCVWTQLAMASDYRTEHVWAFSFWMQPCWGIFLLNAAVSGHFPSGRSRVRANRVQTTRVMAPRSCCPSRHGNRSKYSCHICKHAAGSRHSDSVQFYSFYLMYIYICYYYTSRGNKGKLANTTRYVEHNAMSTTR